MGVLATPCLLIVGGCAGESASPNTNPPDLLLPDGGVLRCPDGRVSCNGACLARGERSASCEVIDVLPWDGNYAVFAVLALDDVVIYTAGASVHSYEVHTGESRLLARLETWGRLAGDADDVFVGGLDAAGSPVHALYRIPREGGEPRSVVGGLDGVAQLDLLGAKLYFLNGLYASDRLVEVAPDGSSTRVLTQPDVQLGVVSDGTALYLLGDAIRRFDPVGGTDTSLARNPGWVDLVSDSDFIYGTPFAQANQEVQRMRKTGGEPATVVVTDYARAIIDGVSGEAVYFHGQAPDVRFFRVISGQGPELVATAGRSSDTKATVTDTDIYAIMGNIDRREVAVLRIGLGKPVD